MPLDDYSYAARLRDNIRRIAGAVVDEMRPEPRYAKVISINRTTRVCEVKYKDSDASSVPVKMGVLQPNAVNQVVRVEGVSTDRYITDVMGQAYVNMPTPAVGAHDHDLEIAAIRSSQVIMNRDNQRPTRWDGSNLSWTDRVIALGVNRQSWFANPGWIGWYTPAAGTVIPGSMGAGNVTTVAAGIPLSGHQILWGVPPTDGSATGTLAITGYTAVFTVPDHWVWLAGRSESTDSIKTAWAGTVGRWLEMTGFPANVSAYQTGIGNSWTPRYRKDNGMVTLAGLLNVNGNPITVWTLPVGYRPANGDHMFSAMTSSSYARRMDIGSDGSIVYREGPSIPYGGWHSISCSFPAEN